MPEPVSIVIPTLGRATITELLARLSEEIPEAAPVEIIVVDDRPENSVPLMLVDEVVLARGAERGPAAARNAGWRAAQHDWVVFLDDDVVPEPGWWERLQSDLAQPADVAGVQGNIHVPVPDRYEMTDWEHNTAGLERARWITADMAYRRSALEAVGGFDERLPRAYREDADLAYRVSQEVGGLVVGERQTLHPVRVEGPWHSLRAQAGNADDAFLRRRYGPDWRHRLGIPRGRRRRHAAIVAVGAIGVLASLTGRRRIARLATLGWLAGTTEFALARARLAPGELSEPGRLIATSALIPPLAVGHWLAGWWRHRAIPPYPMRHGLQEGDRQEVNDQEGEPVFGGPRRVPGGRAS